jgi:hypothetical protein
MIQDFVSSAEVREALRWAHTKITASETIEVRRHVGSVSASEGGGTLSVDVVIIYEPNPALGGTPLIRTAAFVELNGRRLALEEVHKLRRLLIRAANMARDLS